MIELLTVLAVASILATLSTIGLQAVTGGPFNSELSQLSNTLVRARAYALANNTYVYVGIQEVNASVPATTVPQVAGTGRVAITVVATNDGTRGYLPTMTTSTAIPDSTVSATTKLNVISPLVHLDNLHVFARGTGASALPQSPTSYTNPLYYNITSSSATSLTKFTWPVGATTPQYTFGPNSSSPSTVIQFNPQGEAQIFKANSDSVMEWIEIDVEAVHGTTVPATTNPDNASIFIDGQSGNVSVFRI